MKKILFFITIMALSAGLVQAQGKAEIKSDKITHDFGTFSENNPIVSCTFKLTNIGNNLLVTRWAVASCGCTVPEYTQEPIMPGKTGTIKVAHNGTDEYPGHFKKSIALRTSAKTEIIRPFVKSDMTVKDAKQAGINNSKEENLLGFSFLFTCFEAVLKNQPLGNPINYT